MLFRKTADSKELETKIKETETKANQEISDIEKLTDAAERLKRYQALSQTLRGVYDGGKPGKVRGRKETRAKYGSVKNAHTLYSLEKTVKGKAEKEAAAINAANRTAQIQQQFDKAFSPVTEAAAAPKDKGSLFKDIEAKTKAEIKDIEKLAEPAERLARYRALNTTLYAFYNDDRPTVRERKKFRPVYGGIKNARAMYKLEEAIGEKIKKELEIIRSLERTAQLQQRFEASFGKEAAAKDKTGIIKGAKAEISEEIQEIKKIADPAERVARYQALDKTIGGFYDGIKPKVMDSDVDIVVPAAFLSAMAGDVAAGVIVSIVAPAAALPVIITVCAAGAISGAMGGAGLSGLLGGKEERKQLRAKYGSIRNARAMYKLDKTVQKKAEKDAQPIHAAKLRQQLDAAFKKEDPAAPAESAPASTPLKLHRPPEAKQ